jgi:hypothetical protein
MNQTQLMYPNTLVCQKLLFQNPLQTPSNPILKMSAANTNNFQSKLKSLMAEYDLGIKSTAGLSGIELEEMNNNNEGMSQLYEAIAELHMEFLASAPKKRSIATKEPAAKPEKKAEKADKDQPEKKKRATKAKKADDEPAETAEKKSKAPSAYSLFTSNLNKVNKGELPDMKKITVLVSLETVSKSGEVLLKHEAAAALLEMKNTEQTIETLLEACKDLLSEVEGKVQPFKLSGLMWSAVGNKTPF